MTSCLVASDRMNLPPGEIYMVRMETMWEAENE